MNLKLKRKKGTALFTEGKLFINNGFSCYTAEDADRHLESNGCNAKVDGKTCIPRGIYKVTISKSKRFGKFLIEILDVPCFNGIRIHSGNSSKDTEGCIIVGSINTKDNDDWVGGSKIAYEQLHKKVKEALSSGEEVFIEIV